LFLTLRELRIN